MLHHIEGARFMADGEMISMGANVYENGPDVKVMLYQPETGRWLTYAKMRYDSREMIGNTVRYRGVPSGQTRHVTWNVTPEPCRSCR